MIGRLVSFWECLFLGAMLNFWGVRISHHQRMKGKLHVDEYLRQKVGLGGGIFLTKTFGEVFSHTYPEHLKYRDFFPKFIYWLSIITDSWSIFLKFLSSNAIFQAFQDLHLLQWWCPILFDDHVFQCPILDSLFIKHQRKENVWIWSGQITIFHKPRCPWNKEMSLPQLPFGGPGHVRLL